MAPKPDPMHAPQIKPIMSPTLPPECPPMKRPARPTPTVQKTLFIIPQPQNCEASKTKSRRYLHFNIVVLLQRNSGSLSTVQGKCPARIAIRPRFENQNLTFSHCAAARAQTEVPSKSNPSKDRSTQWDHSDHYSWPLRLCESRPTTGPVRSSSWHRMALLRFRCPNIPQLYQLGPYSRDTSNL